MNYTNEYNNGENIIVVNEWKGVEPHAAPPEFIDDEEYYYQMEMCLDDNDCFESLRVKKVGGGDNDDARGGEWYEELDRNDIEWIIKCVARECF